MRVQVRIYVGPHVLLIWRCKLFIRGQSNIHLPAPGICVRPVGAAVAVAWRWRLRSRGGGGRRRRHDDGDDGDGGGGQMSAMISHSIWEKNELKSGINASIGRKKKFSTETGFERDKTAEISKVYRLIIITNASERWGMPF